MNTRQKLEIIQKMLGLTQTKLALRFGVSFAAFNSWWTGKSSPRAKMHASIDELFLEVTGQKTIPSDQLTAKKQTLGQKSREHIKCYNSFPCGLCRRDLVGKYENPRFSYKLVS